MGGLTDRRLDHGPWYRVRMRAMSSHMPCTTPHLIAPIVSAVQAGEDHDLVRLLAAFASVDA
jgi:hypothetical protein